MNPREKHNDARTGNEGFLILEALIAVGILVGMMSFISSHFNNRIRGTTRVEQISDKGELRIYIASAVSCRKTEAVSNCTGSFPLRRTTASGEKNLFPGINGSPDGPEGSYRFGRYFVKAMCDTSGESLLVKAVPAYTKDALKGGKVLTFADPESDLFGGSSGLSLCFNLNVIGTSTQASVNHFTEWTLRSNPVDATANAADGRDLAALGLKDEEFGGITCNRAKGYKLTGCYNKVLRSDHPQSDDGDTHAINNSCFARKQRKVGRQNGYVENILTAICLKAE